MVREGKTGYPSKRLLGHRDRRKSDERFASTGRVRYPLRTMHDLGYFREHLDDVYAPMLGRRNMAIDFKWFRELDENRRKAITEAEQLKARRNKTSDEIARLKKNRENADSLITEMKEVGDRIKSWDERAALFDAQQREFLLTIPNLPHSS